MRLRFYVDSETGLPHINNHGITEDEIREVFAGRGEDGKADRNTRMRIGQTAADRYLQVIYSSDQGGENAFVVTAYELKVKAQRAYRRRQRRRRR